MHSRVKAQRIAQAQERISASASNLATDLGINAAARVGGIPSTRDPELNQLYQLEAMADLLEEVATTVIGGTVLETDGAIVDAVLDELERVKGVGPTTLKAIRDHFDSLEELVVEVDATDGEGAN